MTSDVTILIAFFSTCNYRKNSFLFVRDYIVNCGIPLVVCEQTNEDKKSFQEGSYKHFYVNIDGPFNKSKLYNFGAKNILTKHIWFLDSDIILDFGKVISKLNNQEFVRPFGPVYMLSEKQSTAFKKGFAIDLKQVKNTDLHFSKHSFIIRSDIFHQSKGFDEKFSGWGWEDIDFSYNKMALCRKEVFDNLCGFHFFHPPASRFNERNNYLNYLENSGNRPGLSICSFLDSNFDFDNFKKMLSSSGEIHNSIDFCIFTNLEKESVPIEKLSLIQSDFPSVSLFWGASKLKKIKDKMNCAVYISIGSLVSYFDNSFVPDYNFFQKSLSSTSSLFNVGESLFISRDLFDSANGYADFKTISECNKDLESRSSEILENKSYNFYSSFGLRDGLEVYNFKTKSFSPL